MIRSPLIVALLIGVGCSEPTGDHATHVRPNRDGTPVIGPDLSQEDVSAILDTITASDLLLDKRVLSIYRMDTTKVVVRTGVVRGALDGGGDIVHLELNEGKWKVVDVVHWIS